MEIRISILPPKPTQLAESQPSQPRTQGRGSSIPRSLLYARSPAYAVTGRQLGKALKLLFYIQVTKAPDGSSGHSLMAAG